MAENQGKAGVKNEIAGKTIGRKRAGKSGFGKKQPKVMSRKAYRAK